jgi:hypothetical protein
MEKEILEWIRCCERDLELAYAELHHHFPHHPHCQRQKVKQVLIILINKQKFIIMGQQTLQVGNQAPILEALVDAATLQPIPDATKVAKSKTFDTPAVATVDANGNLVAVAPGNGNLTVVNTWTYKDQVTGQTVTADETTVQAYAVIPAPEGVLQVVTLGPAVPIPSQAVAPTQA